MKEKTYVLLVLFSVALILSVVMGYNYFADKSGLFQRDFSQKRIEPNQHIVKMRYILEYPDKYNAFCFGASRVGNIDLEKIQDGNRYYNMTYSEGLPSEWLADIRILLKHGVVMKKLLIGLDDIALYMDPKMHQADYLRLPYKENSMLHTDLTYLLKSPMAPLDAETEEAAMSYYDIYGTGRPLHPWADERIEADVSAHKADPRFREEQEKHKVHRVDETLAEIAAIKNLADEHDIELLVFINPIYYKTYEANDAGALESFKRRLAEITNYYDFSGRNEITMDSYYYYETSHYRPLVGDMMIDRMFHQSADAPADFGVYVTPENIEEHLKR